MTPTLTSVCAVVVTFDPAPDQLRELVHRVREQVSTLVVVDNGPGELAGDLGPGVAVLRQPVNVGLAEAVNRGISWARERGSSHVLVLDQDSWPEPGMVRALLEASAELSRDHRVGAVGPRQFDPRVGEFAPFVEVGFPMSRKLHCATGTVRSDFLIGSGMLVALPVLDEVGEMDEGLFIDNVDLDWCFRARQLGYSVFGVGDARMQHRLGERWVSLLGGRVRVAQHAPVRLYFIMRNRLALYRRRHTPRIWVAQDIPRVLVKLVLFGVLIGPRRLNLHYLLSGLLDGFRGATGPGPVATARVTQVDAGAPTAARVVPT